MSSRADPVWPRLLPVTLVATVGMLPAFLLGATSPFVRREFSISSVQLGLGVAAFWVGMGLCGVWGGRVAQRLGPSVVLRGGAALCAACLLGVAAAGRWWEVVALLVLAGTAAAMATPGTDLALMHWLPPARLPVAFGVKQASLPAASLLAGLGVPVLALTLGWRWAFVAGAGLAALSTVLLPRGVPDPWHGRRSGPASPAGPGGPGAPGPRSRVPAARLRGVPAVAVGVALAMCGVSATGAFYVESAVAHGIPVGRAGLLLAAGSVCAALGRLTFSARFSGSPRPIRVSAALVAVGGIAVLGLVVARSEPALLLVSAIAFTAGWGWNGLLTFAVVRSHPGAQARASGILVVGGASGGVLGPLGFGAMLDHVGLTAAWLLAAAELGLAAALWLSVERELPPVPQPHRGSREASTRSGDVEDDLAVDGA